MASPPIGATSVLPPARRESLYVNPVGRNRDHPMRTFSLLIESYLYQSPTHSARYAVQSNLSGFISWTGGFLAMVSQRQQTAFPSWFVPSCPRGGWFMSSSRKPRMACGIAALSGKAPPASGDDDRRSHAPGE